MYAWDKHRSLQHTNYVTVSTDAVFRGENTEIKDREWLVPKSNLIVSSLVGSSRIPNLKKQTNKLHFTAFEKCTEIGWRDYANSPAHSEDIQSTWNDVCILWSSFPCELCRELALSIRKIEARFVIKSLWKAILLLSFSWKVSGMQLML